MARASKRNVFSGVLFLFLAVAWLPVLEDQFASLEPQLGRASPDQESLRPNADGEFVEWTISDSTHYGATNDDSDTTYVYSGTANDREYLNVDNMVASPSTINWVQIVYRMYSTGGGAPEKVNFGLRSDSTTTITDAGESMSGFRGSWGNFTGTQQTVNPADSQAWEKADVDGLQSYMDVKNIGGGEKVRCSEIWVVVDFSVGDTDPPLFPDFTGTTNNSNVACWTSLLGNWSIDDVGDNPDSYIIYANTTGTNESKTSGTYNDGDYKWWEFTNDNVSLVGKTIFIEIWANDTTPNWNNSIVYFNITNYFSLDITEIEFNWTSPNVIKDSGVWVYIDVPAKQYLNLSLKGAPNWEIRGYYNRTEAELHVKVFITNSTGGSMPEAEGWWDTGGSELSDSEQVISGGDNQPAGDYTATADHYRIWIVIQVDDGGANSYGMLLTLLIYQNV